MNAFERGEIVTLRGINDAQLYNIIVMIAIVACAEKGR